MKVGLIGLPGSGKTSLFNALTRSQARIHDYDAHDTTVNVATVPVPDPRFDIAVEICKPKKQVQATIEVVDGAARVQAHERGHTFGSDFFSGIRSVDALVLVLGAFRDSDDGAKPSPARDADLVAQELVLADLTLLDARLERLDKGRAAKRQTAADAAEETAIRSLHAILDDMRPIRSADLTLDEERVARNYALVTAKPLILALNVAESDVGADRPFVSEAAALASANGLPLIALCAKLEAEIAQMSPDEERDYVEALGLSESARDALIRVSYEQLGLISFLTVGSDEVRTWTIARGTTALGAAEKVHTDLARTFIRAEVMPFEEFRLA
ncbi:MAG: redox-regulated ATPase YchF, partial [Armatimonadetes bacterium]|nr:redox-regulated ATPase YchF [Armatimonadota bacterium]